MKNILFATGLFFITAFASCKKQQCLNIPDCIANKIVQLKNAPKQNLPAVIVEFTYRNKKVYYITSDCCDPYNYLYDSDCNVLCAPDGGIAGHDDGTCKDFNQIRSDGNVVWKDNR